MLAYLGRLSVVSMLVVVMGGQWALLQSIGWVGMFLKFSQTEAVSAAIEKTFDGKHPCNICKAVQEGKRSEKKQESQKLETKLDFICLKQLLALETPPPFACPISSLDDLLGRTESPPRPPPRAA
jgi:hypothetical protein